MERIHTKNFSWRSAVASCSLIALIVSLLTLSISRTIRADEIVRDFLTNLLFSNAIGLLGTAGLVAVWPRIQHRAVALRAVLITLVLSAAAAVGTVIGCAFLVATGRFSAGEFATLYFWTLRFALFITFVFGGGLFLFELMRGRLQAATLELRTRELEKERALKLATEAQLSSLESRIHPHFLFNALNSISSLVREDPALAERTIERLAALLRFSLDSARLRVVPLRQELKIVRDYLDIEQVRFGARLRYSVEAPAELEELTVPPLTLQTLVENSVKYAVAPRREGGTIRVSAEREGDALRLSVRDDGAGFDLAGAPAGHGLDNLRSRLEAMFGPAAALEIRSDAFTCVSVTIPARLWAAVA